MFCSLSFCVLSGLLAGVACGWVSQSPSKLGAGIMMAAVASGRIGIFHLNWGWSSGSHCVLWSSWGSSGGQDMLARRGGLILGGLGRPWESRGGTCLGFWLPAWPLGKQVLPLEFWAGISWIFTLTGRNAYLTCLCYWVYICGVTGCVYCYRLMKILKVWWQTVWL